MRLSFRLYIASQSENGMSTAGYFLFLFFKVNPGTLLDLLMCVQPAPCKLRFTEVPAALFLASPGPNNPLHTPASKVPTYHFQILKTMIQLLLSGLWSSPSLWPNPMDTSLFSSYLATSYFLELSLTLAFVTSLSLLIFLISVDRSINKDIYNMDKRYWKK